jgi:hypothetical protein
MTTPSFGDMENLSAYLDEQLSESERTHLEMRLRTDSDLAEALEELSQTRGLLQRTPKRRAPRNFTLTPGMAGIHPPVPRLVPVFSWAAAVAMLLFIFTLGTSLVGRLSFNAAAPMLAAAPSGFGGGPVAAETKAPAGVAPAPMAAPPIAPATSAPATLAPAVAGPAPMAPATLAPATLAPATLAPATLAPAVAAPAPIASATLAPATLISAMAAPPPIASATLVPATLAPAEAAPAPMASATLAPATLAPATLAPAAVPQNNADHSGLATPTPEALVLSAPQATPPGAMRVIQPPAAQKAQQKTFNIWMVIWPGLGVLLGSLALLLWWLNQRAFQRKNPPG